MSIHALTDQWEAIIFFPNTRLSWIDFIRKLKASFLSQLWKLVIGDFNINEYFMVVIRSSSQHGCLYVCYLCWYHQFPTVLADDPCTCKRNGNYYTVRSADKCGSFMQRTAFLPAVTQYCPAGLQFDLKLCVCNYPQDTVCPYNCPAAYSAPAYKSSKYYSISVN